MAINFPSTPSNGDTHAGYTYDATNGVWNIDPFQTLLGVSDLSDTDVDGVADGEALIYNSSTSKWEPGSAAPSGVNTIASDNINIDFSDNVPLETRTVTGDVTFTASNYTAGAKKTIYLEGDTVQRSLTFPTDWNFINDKPTAIGADRKNILDLNSFGTSESTTVALWLGPTAWASITATGGAEATVVDNGITYKVHSFLNSGSFIVSDLGESTSIEILMVGGGGSGGAGTGGGGGAGGLIYIPQYDISATTYAVTVGAGGTNDSNDIGTAGQDTLFYSGSTSLTAFGGGYGASTESSGSWPPSSGGSGGGGQAYSGSSSGGASTQAVNTSDGSKSYPGTGFGNAGENGNSSSYSAGGGGAGGAPSGGRGGEGRVYSLTGAPQYYAAGGNGGNTSHASVNDIGGYHLSPNGTDGVANTGSGGGGGWAHSGGVGGNGGSGIVIVRYQISAS